MGNELADEAAKRATRAQCTRFLPLPASDFLASCTGYIRGKWQVEWDESRPSKLKALKPRLEPWSSSSRCTRRYEVVSRLRIGHTLDTRCYLLVRENKPDVYTAGSFYRYSMCLCHVVIWLANAVFFF